ncbi:hypothetical protein CH063_14017 [Colletotrichum higginsianum]|uniref:Uncharacterized protein n=1 Tax=Colletotrichum higginsianum (strain IMI 349063) TaxID=759273 RepID=H1VWU0_COLHI|nr:hypothetical protein CH063_14017 [Colletotrichum higginsianum]
MITTSTANPATTLDTPYTYACRLLSTTTAEPVLDALQHLAPDHAPDSRVPQVPTRAEHRSTSDVDCERA